MATDLFGVRERVLGSATPEPRAPAISRDAGGAAGPAIASPTTAQAPTVLRSQPWWQGVADLKGNGSTTPAGFTIDGGAIQWRVRWHCDGAHLTVHAADRSRPLFDAACPGDGQGYANGGGPKTLSVTADGAWKLVVEQQVDVPLVEPPLASMSAPGSKVVASGELYRIDQSGTGRVSIYRLADGGYALRLDDFFVTANVDLEIRLSPLEAPHSTDQYLSAPSEKAAPLDITAGSLNFPVPAGLDPTRYRSVVVWCPLINSAYAAATLAPAR
jgi:hypothetical protein